MAKFESDPIHHEKSELSELFIGRSIVECKIVGYGEVLYTLDNGKQLRLIPNEGCGGCENGHYTVTDFTKFPHIITGVKVKDDKKDVERDNVNGTVELFVYGEGLSERIAEVKGRAGNGYYGRGFAVTVIQEF